MRADFDIGASGGICELVLEADDVERLAGFYGELRLPLLAREGDRVELWDFFEDGEGAHAGVGALAETGDGA